MDVFEDDEDRISATTAERRSAIRVDLVGAAEAAALLGIGRAALWERRKSHDNFPRPIAELRCGPIWFRWQIQDYQAEERRLGPRGWYGGRLHPWRSYRGNPGSS